MRYFLRFAGVIGMLSIQPDLSASFLSLCGGGADSVRESKVAIAPKEKSCLTIESKDDVLYVQTLLRFFFKENNDSVKALARLLPISEVTSLEKKNQAKGLLIKIWKSWTVIAAYFRENEDKANKELATLSELVWENPTSDLIRDLNSDSLKELRALVNSLVKIVNAFEEVQ